MDDYEEVKAMLAEMVVWARSEVLCPFHAHIDVALMTREGIVEWHGPVCEAPEGQAMMEFFGADLCEYRTRREELVQHACEVLGTRDMTEFLL